MEAEMMSIEKTLFDKSEALELFLKIGLAERTANKTVKNSRIAINLIECISEAKVTNGCHERIGKMIYKVATMFPENARAHRPTLLQYVASSQIRTLEQLDDAIQYFIITDPDEFDAEDFQKECGLVGDHFGDAPMSSEDSDCEGYSQFYGIDSGTLGDTTSELLALKPVVKLHTLLKVQCDTQRDHNIIEDKREQLYGFISEAAMIIYEHLNEVGEGIIKEFDPDILYVIEASDNGMITKSMIEEKLKKNLEAALDPCLLPDSMSTGDLESLKALKSIHMVKHIRMIEDKRQNLGRHMSAASKIFFEILYYVAGIKGYDHDGPCQLLIIWTTSGNVTEAILGERLVQSVEWGFGTYGLGELINFKDFATDNEGILPQQLERYVSEASEVFYAFLKALALFEAVDKDDLCEALLTRMLGREITVETIKEKFTRELQWVPLAAYHVLGKLPDMEKKEGDGEMTWRREVIKIARTFYKFMEGISEHRDIYYDGPRGYFRKIKADGFDEGAFLEIVLDYVKKVCYPNEAKV